MFPLVASAVLPATCATTSRTCQAGHPGTGSASSSSDNSFTSAVTRARVPAYSSSLVMRRTVARLERACLTGHDGAAVVVRHLRRPAFCLLAGAAVALSL